MKKHILSYYLIRITTFPLSFLSYKTIHFLGKVLSILGYFILKEYRKTALSNLAMAKELPLSEKEMKKLAKKSFQNLFITILELPKLHREKNFKKIVKCINPDTANNLFSKKQGIIFFCGHQANWELLFIDGNTRMNGVAFAKPIKNKMLYRWIISIREKTDGKIIDKKNGIKKGIKALKEGKFLGIVGDQAEPNSFYLSNFLGREAYTSPLFALLSYKTNSPIIVATIQRKDNKYYIKYSDPIWPNLKNSKKNEIYNLMNQSLSILQNSIKENPEQWLWQHNRWKKQNVENIYKKFRRDSICIILPQKNLKYFEKVIPTFRKIYNKEFLSIFTPKPIETVEIDEIRLYKNIDEIMVKDYRFKLVFNLTEIKKIKHHFKKLSAIDVFDLKNLRKEAQKKYPKKEFADLNDILKSAILRKG
ncbi:MAG: hypothetical protein AMS24_00895 [Chlamydiae bacterium SM23_39]|nr:MAG: hypothetical protein AMS24_00895 [Chlamydiae bacterium SM23_39]